MIPYQRNISHHYLAFKKSVENIKGIESVSTSAAPMYGGIDMTAAHYKDAMDNIFISEMYVDQQCLGLFGLAAYIAEQRTKEIGIRKVLGASVSQVWLLLSKDFIVLVLISCVIASPVAFYYMHDWLQQYDYRITITPVVFVIAGIAAIVITIITISFQAIKAAMANPVKSLRTE